MLDGLAVAMLIGDVQVAKAKRPEQPLVTDGDQEVRRQHTHIERQRPHGLARVHHQTSVEFVGLWNTGPNSLAGND